MRNFRVITRNILYKYSYVKQEPVIRTMNEDFYALLSDISSEEIKEKMMREKIN